MDFDPATTMTCFDLRSNLDLERRPAAFTVQEQDGSFRCSCMANVHVGYPCQHLFAVMLEDQSIVFNTNQIHAHWNVRWPAELSNKSIHIKQKHSAPVKPARIMVRLNRNSYESLALTFLPIPNVIRRLRMMAAMDQEAIQTRVTVRIRRWTWPFLRVIARKTLTHKRSITRRGCDSTCQMSSLQKSGDPSLKSVSKAAWNSRVASDPTHRRLPRRSRPNDSVTSPKRIWRTRKCNGCSGHQQA